MRGMHIQFLGGATTVTGSQFLISTERAKVLVDCGMFQGSPNESVRNRVPFGFDASKALPTDNPGRVCAMLASARDPMVFTGKDLDGPTFFAEHAGVSFAHPGQGTSAVERSGR